MGFVYIQDFTVKNKMGFVHIFCVCVCVCVCVCARVRVYVCVIKSSLCIYMTYNILALAINYSNV